MYVPKAFAVDDHTQALAVLRAVPFGHLVTSVDRLESTALPFLIDDELTLVSAHVARANDHWRRIDGAEALLIVPTVDAYISPRWYPTKASDAKVVPTWNYELVHVHGTIEVVHDDTWKLDTVTALTDLNEARTPGDSPAWRVDDAPDDYINKMLSAIVGLRMKVRHIEAKRKLSQNKPQHDRLGAAEALLRSDRQRDREVGSLMRSADG